MTKYTENYVQILVFEEGIEKMHKEGRLVGERYEKALENAAAMRRGDSLANSLSVEEIIKMHESGKDKDLSVIEQQYLAAKVMGLDYPDYCLYVKSAFDDIDAVIYEER